MNRRGVFMCPACPTPAGLQAASPVRPAHSIPSGNGIHATVFRIRGSRGNGRGFKGDSRQPSLFRRERGLRRHHFDARRKPEFVKKLFAVLPRKTERPDVRHTKTGDDV